MPEMPLLARYWSRLRHGNPRGKENGPGVGARAVGLAGVSRGESVPIPRAKASITRGRRYPAAALPPAIFRA